MLKIRHIKIPDGALFAPMAGVSDPAFRLICSEMGASMTCTEMISAQGLYYSPDRAGELRHISPGEHPVAMQIFGSSPDRMADMAKAYGEGFDIIDINMGCPAPKIIKGGQGAALMKNTDLAQKIVSRMKQTVPQPVTVKIRAGWDEDHINAVDFAKAMEQAGADALTIHGRTRMQFYHGQSDWHIIKDVKNALSIPVIGNGDVRSGADAMRLLELSGCDAVMVGRGAQGNPFIFREIRHYLKTKEALSPPSAKERMDTALRHACLLKDIYGEDLTARMMRKHLMWYTKGIPGAASLRCQAVKVCSIEDIKNFVNLITDTL